MIRQGVQYVTPQGMLTKAGYDALQGLDGALLRLAAAEARLEAIAAVSPPGGGTPAAVAVAAVIAAAG